MKIYRCVIGSLLVLFIAIGVWYVVSCYDERRSTEDGLLIWGIEDILDESNAYIVEVGRDIVCHR